MKTSQLIHLLYILPQKRFSLLLILVNNDNYLELVEVCLLRGWEEAELEFLVLGPSVIEGVALTSSVLRKRRTYENLSFLSCDDYLRQKNSSSSS